MDVKKKRPLAETTTLKDHVDKFIKFINKLHENTKFTSKIEENASLLQLLDIKINCENNKFAT